jgi:hypothetical protein
MTSNLLLAIDQGTTGTTALLVDENLEVRGRGYREIPQLYPAPGWVEHDPEAIWASVLGAVAEARTHASGGAIAGIGITNQRETVVCWDRASGQPLWPAIVWQDRRTADRCAAMRQAGLEETFQRHTGLLLDPYFSGTKLAWLLDNVEGLRERATAGAVALGTVDSFLVWRLSGGASFAHLALRPRAPRLASGAVPAAHRARGGLAPGGVLVGQPGHGPRRPWNRGRHAHRRHRRGSAGRALRARLPRSRRREVHLRHRLVPAHERRRPARALAAPPARHRRLADE